MTPHDVARSYDRLAAHWDSDAFPRDNGMEQHRRALAFCAGRGAALDIGCGSSGRVMDCLLAAGFRAEGLDLSGEMLTRARRRHPEQTFYHADICEWKYPQSYDFISAWDSIWHVPLPAMESVLTGMLGALNPGGVAIFSFGGTPEPSDTTDFSMGPPMYHSTLGTPRTLDVVSRAGILCRHLEYDQFPELHAYIIGQRPREQ